MPNPNSGKILVQYTKRPVIIVTVISFFMTVFLSSFLFYALIKDYFLSHDLHKNINMFVKACKDIQSNLKIMKKVDEKDATSYIVNTLNNLKKNNADPFNYFNLNKPESVSQIAEKIYKISVSTDFTNKSAVAMMNLQDLTSINNTLIKKIKNYDRKYNINNVTILLRYLFNISPTVEINY